MSDTDPMTVRVLVHHAAKLAHLDRPERERRAERITKRIALFVAVTGGGLTTLALALLWLVIP